MVKTITIKDGVYEELVIIKRENESFSDLLERLAKAVSPTDALIKVRGCVEFRDKKKMISEIQSRRGERRI